MIKKIRLKFVIVTMSLLTVLFSLLFFVSHVYNNYLFQDELMHLLEMAAETGMLSEIEYYAGEEYTDIYVARLDADGQLVSLHSTQNAEQDRIRETIADIAQSGSTRGRHGSYIFVSRLQTDGETAVALANLYNAPIRLKQIAAAVILILTAYALLFCITLYLSRFVTEPARVALEREKQFISDASHELKTPVAAIVLNAQAMTKAGQTSRHLDIIRSEAERMKSLIQRLLTLAYADECDDKMQRQHFSLSDCCEALALSFESLAFEQDIRFTYEIAENISYYGVFEDIRQVVSILLDNAFKYTGKGGEVTISLSMQRMRPVLHIRNTGEGIAPEDLPHIFERFYCKDKSRHTSGSFGLGLAIAYAAVRAHGGNIKVKSEYGEYAEFTVLF